ncbi:MAG TPA: tRNA lysidine(34) synthetase TilS [Chitinophagales bacterium]|nr:tRNA lysidine(34) synthetase TilS [Chitinophagales bacterium]
MQHSIENALITSDLFNKSTPLLIASSGGRDSMALLFGLMQSGFNYLEVAHCNFQLREKESDDDELFIQDYCLKNNIPFHTTRFETKQVAKEKGISTQMAARDLRYEWLEKIRKENELHLIVAAHHQDDQLETVLLNLIQGTGIHGLKGMMPKNEKIVRPLLQVSRTEINQYIELNNIPYREDSSNNSTDYKRNFIRHEIAPLFNKINSNYVQEISDFSKRMAQSAVLFDEQIQKIRKKVLVPWKEGHQLFINYILLHPACDTIFHEILSPFGLKRDQIQEILLTAKGLKKKNASGQTFYSEQFRFVMDKKSLFILPIDNEIQSLITYDKWPNQIIFNEYKIEVRLQPIAKVNIKKSDRYAYLDADKIHFPIQIKYPETGDYFYPFGMGKAKNPEKAGKKKLSKYFKDEHISVAERERIPILKSEEKIVSLIGLRIDDRFKITECTQNVVVLVIK